jgi:hypothetical protein
MDDYCTPRQRVLSTENDHSPSFEASFEDSPMTRTPITPRSFIKKINYDTVEIGKEYRIVSKTSVESDSDADSCLTNYDLKQLFQVTQIILEREEDILKSNVYDLNPSRIEAEPSLDSTLLQEENHALESKNLDNEITTAVDKLAYGHVSCEEWKMLTPLSNVSKKIKHEADSSFEVYSKDVEKYSRNTHGPSDDRDENIFYKLMDTLCCYPDKSCATEDR